ncbi:hypothetical protein COV93_07320 [Candidatus Woesearchaeota archaeon CG11_big_fil_rev_8_21_14_0_20_43_8]|nr:MAG: hypothetical protein COV93_07320 [Candidatus Woesearchaeota archaeon CG11_big_fil_rev_8_21_14_0_20_43_8]PIO08837.1 MAG: hypothetical protein COT47_01025 [Candidatus Woesearchaeota archaeon CG08_land_8_20_14_0_20_43_7]
MKKLLIVFVLLFASATVAYADDTWKDNWLESRSIDKSNSHLFDDCPEKGFISGYEGGVHTGQWSETFKSSILDSDIYMKPYLTYQDRPFIISRCYWTELVPSSVIWPKDKK